MRSAKLALWAFLAVSLPAILTQGQSTDRHWFHPIPQGEQPAPRTGATIMGDGGTFLLFGGLADSPRNDLWRYSLYTNTWTVLNPTGPRPPERFGHAVVNDIVSRIMFVFGGQGRDGVLLNDVWAYDYRRNVWRQVVSEGPAPAPRYGHTAILPFARGGMVISHGFTASGETDDTWRFGGGAWTEISPAAVRPPARGSAGAGLDETAEGAQMLLFGGCAPSVPLCPLGDFWSFDVETNSWTARSTGPLPPARQRSSLVSDTSLLGHQLILFGGSGENGLLADAWQYKPENDTWTELSPGGTPPSPRAGHSGAFIRAYGAVFFGGNTSDGLSNEVWILAPPAGPVVNAASFQSNVLVPGSIVSLFGTDFATGTASAVGLPLPDTLAGTRVQVNGSLAPLFYVSPTQINFQVPWRVAGGTLGAISLDFSDQSIATVPIVSASPGIFTVEHNGEGQGAVLIAGTGSYAAPVGEASRGFPVARGGYIEIYATGLGAVDNEPRDGSLASSDPLSRTIATPSVTIGGVPAEVTFSGLAPGQVGLYQVNARVPHDAPVGDFVPLVLSMEGAVSNTVTIAVRE